MSGSAYFIAPDAPSAPAVLVLHSWWGLNNATRSICDSLADAGFAALAPDLIGDGRTTENLDEARAWLAASDPNVTAKLITSSATVLRGLDSTPDAPIGVLGMSMGASWGLWLASRAPESIAAAAVFYGTQQVDRLNVTAAVQGHFAEDDPMVDNDELVLMDASLHLDGLDVEFFTYPDVDHWFFEPGPYFDDAAANLAWQRLLPFFSSHLPRASGGNERR